MQTILINSNAHENILFINSNFIKIQHNTGAKDTVFL